jgi:putative addiction module killer protein
MANGSQLKIFPVVNHHSCNSKSINCQLGIDRGPGYRIYFGWDGKVLVILLGGSTKLRQHNDIDAALARLQATQGRRQERLTMPLTRDFRLMVQARAARDPAFRKALFQEAVQSLLQGDIDTGRAAMRDTINATVGFEKLSAALGKPQKSLMRMFGPGGNPTAENLLGVIGVLQAETGVHLEVRVVADAA